jgi:hypothetical protein
MKRFRGSRESAAADLSNDLDTTEHRLPQCLNQSRRFSIDGPLGGRLFD